MPGKYIIKKYKENSYYHIFNRGVGENEIFLDKQDYKIFLNYLKIYLLPKNVSIKNIEQLKINSIIKDKLLLEISYLTNFYERIKILCFVLMNNHFHFLIWQKESRDIVNFMKSLLTRYTMYFNNKYNRVGPLFQSRYKGILIEKENYFLHLSRYIHYNPKAILGNKPLENYPWSSYPAYLGKMNYSWLNKDPILSYFDNIKGLKFNSYKGFVEDYEDDLLDNYWKDFK